MSLDMQLQAALAARGSKVHPLLMTHVVLGYPTLEESISVVEAMARSGAALVELQIPFSDPIADGPTIMHACDVALANGVRPIDCMKAAERLAGRCSIPLLLMSYYNIPYNFPGSTKGFCSAAQQSGVKGLIIPDVPIEDDAEHYWELAKEHQLSPIPIASPVSNSERLEGIAKIADSFVYCISTTSTTGAKKDLPLEIKSYLSRVRKMIKKPIAVGFGISTSSHVRSLRDVAEIAVVGSATINLVDAVNPAQRIAQVEKFIAELSGTS